MVTCAVLHPGQGSQCRQMALDFYRKFDSVKAMFRLAKEISGFDMYRILSEATDAQLRDTAMTQLSVTVANRAARIALDEHDFSCRLHAGFSLGELSALVGAGIIDDAALFSIIVRRGLLMERAVGEISGRYGKTGMMAVLGLPVSVVADLIAKSGIGLIYVANDNSPKQTVVAGPVNELDRISKYLKDNGARRVVPLKVSGPFHTPLMSFIVKPFAEYLECFTFNTPNGLFISSVSGAQVSNGEVARQLCASQIASPVYWTEAMRVVANLFVQNDMTLLVEAGPNTVMGGLWSTMGTSIDCHPAGTLDAVGKLVGSKGTE